MKTKLAIPKQRAIIDKAITTSAMEDA